VIVIVPVAARPLRDATGGPEGAVRSCATCSAVILILGGIAMLVLPGQGVLAILAGVLLTTFKGKQKLAQTDRAEAEGREGAPMDPRKGERPPLEIPA
jgi:hypothetical protein